MADDDKTEEEMLAEMLLADGLLFLSGDAGPFFKADAPDKTPVSIWVNCNDLFAWGCADAEPLPLDQVAAFYAAWKASPDGDLLWACRRRNMRPQPALEKRMRERGAWTAEFEALPAPPKEAPTS